MKKNILYIILIVLLILAIFKPIKKIETINNPINNNTDIIIKPEPIITIDKNKIYNDLKEAKTAANHKNKKLIIIFTADWCPFCKTLKNDIDIIQAHSQHIICLIDTDKHRDLVSQYNIKTLPTSIILDNNYEEDRKNGYNKDKYLNWLKQL